MGIHSAEAHTIVFPNLRSKPRTHDSFEKQEIKAHHKRNYTTIRNSLYRYRAGHYCERSTTPFVFRSVSQIASWLEGRQVIANYKMVR